MVEAKPEPPVRSRSPAPLPGREKIAYATGGSGFASTTGYAPTRFQRVIRAKMLVMTRLLTCSTNQAEVSSASRTGDEAVLFIKGIYDNHCIIRRRRQNGLPNHGQSEGF